MRHTITMVTHLRDSISWHQYVYPIHQTLHSDISAYITDLRSIYALEFDFDWADDDEQTIVYAQQLTGSTEICADFTAQR